jgi:predicted  nucleic acid-binding Zn-ribbon protein
VSPSPVRSVTALRALHLGRRRVILAELKRERAKLRRQLERLTEARAELEEPSRVLADIEAERQAIEADTAAELALWAQQGCQGQRPTANPERMSALARQRQATQGAIDANAESILEIARQQAAVRQRLAALDEQIAVEAAAVLAAGLEGELEDMKAAADGLNSALARVMGMRVFLLQGGNHAFLRLAERISQLKTPQIGSTKSEVEAAAEGWRQRFEELSA